MAGKTIKLTLHLAALGGILLAVAIIGYHGFGLVIDALLSAGWGLIGVTLYHLVPMACSALGWQALTRTAWRGSALLFLWARLIREAVNALLPVAQIGGDVVGARALTFHGCKPPVAGAGAVVDLTMEVVTQFTFTLIGFGILVFLGGDQQTLHWALLGLAIGAPALVGFILAQRWGLFKLLERLLEKLAVQFNLSALGSLTNLHQTILSLYRDHWGLAMSFFWHMLSWLLGAGEIWLALWLMGAPVSLAEALVLESLGQAIRSAAFLVPGAIGVQEGGYVVLGTLFGLSPEIALALSLVKRVRELLLGVPAILAWQVIEGRRLFADNGTEKVREKG